jgi:hypothetical protein
MSRRMTGTVFRDFSMLMVLGFVAMVVWLLPHVNPPADSSEADPPGNVIVAITWPEGDTDIDLWVTGPGEIRPVGYSNKGGVLFNLLRDDLGHMPDATPLNYENAYSAASWRANTSSTSTATAAPSCLSWCMSRFRSTMARHASGRSRSPRQAWS